MSWRISFGLVVHSVLKLTEGQSDRLAAQYLGYGGLVRLNLQSIGMEPRAAVREDTRLDGRPAGPGIGSDSRADLGETTATRLDSRAILFAIVIGQLSLSIASPISLCRLSSSSQTAK
jgi:hypothetical protein